jgi:hypothetical protein
VGTAGCSGTGLRFSLFRWAVAHDLRYEGNRLIVEHERWLHWFHWWPWAMRQRDVWKERRRQREGHERDKKSGMLVALEAEDEQALRNGLREQARCWHELIMGERPLESHLNLSARFNLAWQGPLLYFVLLVLLAGVVALAGYVLLAIVGGWLAAWVEWALNALVPAQMQPATLKESTEIAKTVIPWLTGLVVFAGGMLRDAWRGAAGLYTRARNWLVRRKVERAVWVPLQFGKRD